ncbi:MAG: lipase, partial [Proteobacteria bacterium]|nr:lipase [Pseudomonadota bacterium]
MLAIVLRTLLVVELLAYAVAALRVLGIAPVLVPLCAVAGVLLVRALPNATIWLLARQWGGGVPLLGFLATARMVLAEYAAFVACFVVILPFERMWMGCDRLAPGDRPPLLLVHGYGCSRGVWWWLRRRLEAAGWSV